jgi:hypothetical protein
VKKLILLFTLAATPASANFFLTNGNAGGCPKALSGTTIVCTLNATPNAGDSIILLVSSVSNSPTVSTITQTGSGCSWTPDVTSAVSGARYVSLWHCSGYSAGAATTITINYGGTIANSDAQVIGEFGGELSASPLDQTNNNASTGGSLTPSPGAVTPSTTSSLIVAAYRRGGNLVSFSPNTWNSGEVSSENSAGWAWTVTNSNSSVTPTFTVDSSGSWGAVVASYKGTGIEQIAAYIQMVQGSNGVIYGHIEDNNNRATSDVSGNISCQNNASSVIGSGCMYRGRFYWDDPTMSGSNYETVSANDIQVPGQTPACPLTGGGVCQGINYTPSSVIGTVHPYDGNPHKIYLLALSAATGGTGVNQTGDFSGTPWQWNVANSEPAPEYVANIPASTLAPAQLAIFANTQDSYSIGVSGSVVCSCPSTGQCGTGATQLLSDGIAGYYIQAHGLSCSQAYTVSTAKVQTASWSGFAGVLSQRNSLSTTTYKAIALAWNIPAIVKASSGNYTASAVSVVANNAFPTETGLGCPEANHGIDISQPPINPWFNSTADPTTVGVMPTMQLAGEAPGGGVQAGKAGPYTVVTGTSDQFKIAVDGGAAAQVTLTPCGGSCTATQIASQLMGLVSGITAWDNGLGYLTIQSNTHTVNGTSSITLTQPSSNSSYGLFWSSPTSTPLAGTVNTCSSSILRSNNGNGGYGCIWGDSFTQGKAVIDAAVANARTAPAGGKIMYMISGDLTRRMPGLMLSNLSLGSGITSKATTSLDGSVGSPTNGAITQTNLLAYYAAQPASSFATTTTFLPGIGVHIINSSTGGYLLQDISGGQTPIAAALVYGAVGAAGHGTEPCEDLQMKNPYGEVWIPRYVAGDVLVNALWASYKYASQDTIIGDPLAQFGVLTVLPGSVMSGVTTAGVVKEERQ